MNLNFEVILFYATLITGIICLADFLVFARLRRRKRKHSEKLPMVIDYSRSFFPVLLIVFLLRSFVFEPFRIPSGSLEPTLLIGDFILVNKYNYGLRLPIAHKKVVSYKDPQRGDIIVVRWPPNPAYNFIKRIIGLPGDKVSYINRELTVNGKKIPQTLVGNAMSIDENGGEHPVIEKQENLMGVSHSIYIDPKKESRDYKDIIVPANMYFVMGDNRDDSADSRYWGFVPDENVVGKAVMIWMSWANMHSMRWGRVGKIIN